MAANSYHRRKRFHLGEAGRPAQPGRPRDAYHERQRLCRADGHNSYPSGTTIGATTADTGTLAVGPDSLGSGAVTFYGPGTLQALGDLSLSSSQVIVMSADGHD